MPEQKGGFSEALHDPKDAIVDIVFVHGLSGDRENTWTKYGVFWPKQVLPSDIPKARILSWGYDASIMHFWSKQSRTELNEHSKLLCSELAGWRSQAVDRPILFVAHSLGGIVCENALAISQGSADDHLKKISSCTRGIIFLGTPLEGSDKAKWARLGQQFAKLVGKDSNKDVVDALKEDSARLRDLRDGFVNFLRARAEEGVANKVEVVCFFEEFPTAAGEIVSEASATIPGYEMQSIPADHRDMCKFASRDELGYQRVSLVLKRWVEKLANPAPAEETKGGDRVDVTVTNNSGQVVGKVSGGQTNHFGGWPRDK